MTPIHLREWQWATVELDGATVAAVAATDAFEIRPDRTPGRWQLRATRHVGVAHLGGVMEVRVEPKVGVRRLVELLAVSAGRIQWDLSSRPELGESPDVVGVVAAALLAQVSELTARGLLHGYQRVDEALPTVKGRIRTAAQMSRRSGLLLPVELRYNRFTADVPENQLLAGAVQVLLRLPGLPPTIRSGLRRLRDALADVSPTPPSLRPPVPLRTRLNQHYLPAIDLAVLVLRSCSLDETLGTRQGTGFLVNMDKVFEDIVTLGLRSRLRSSGHHVLDQQSFPLDRDHRRSIQPDIVIHDDTGRITDVLDVKYKQPDRHDVDQGDLYQVVVYAQRFGLTRVHLVYPEPPPYPQLHINGVTIHLEHISLLDEATGLDELAARLSS